MDFFSKLFDTADFPARWTCGRWTSGHGWLHVISDVAIFGAYLSIPCVLVYFIRKRRDLPFPSSLWLFAAFILACGATHLVEATLFWHPWYRFSGILKAVTAVVSWATVFSLGPTVRKALALPGLAVVNSRLERKVQQRRATERQLQQQAEQLQKYNHELEHFSTAVVGREERVIELKQEVNQLLEELERVPRYATESYQP